MPLHRLEQATTDLTIFESRANEVIARLRAAIANLVNSLGSPTEIRAAVDLERTLKIPKTLAWRIHRAVQAADPFTAARHIPSKQGLDVFLAAAQKAGGVKALIATVRNEFSRYTDLIDTHAGDRKTFQMMLDGLAEEDRDRAEATYRQAAFEALSYVWGVHARVALRIDILAPSADPARWDVATIRAFIDLRRVRPNVSWRIAHAYTVDDTGALCDVDREPLTETPHAGRVPGGLPLVPEFCSRPLPECRRIEGPRGIVEYELVEGAVGNTGLVTCTMGELNRRAEPRYRTERFHEVSLHCQLRTPCELAVYDVLIHRDLFIPRRMPGFDYYGDLFADRVDPKYRDCDRLPVSQGLVHLGTAREPVAPAEVPEYPQMLARVFERCGWAPVDFDVYRAAVRYPPIPSNIIISHPLPEAASRVTDRDAAPIE